MTSGIKWGVIVGVAVYLALLASNALSNVMLAQTGTAVSVTEHPVLLVPLCLSLFVLVFAFSAAGFYTGRETGRAELGALAGAVTLVVQYVLGLVGTALMSGGSHAAAPDQRLVSPFAQMAASVVAALLVLGLAASIGWLGGRPGATRFAKSRALRAAVTSPDVPPSDSVLP